MNSQRIQEIVEAVDFWEEELAYENLTDEEFYTIVSDKIGVSLDDIYYALTIADEGV